MRAAQSSGFTLVELVMVIVIGGAIAAMLAVFMRPAIDSYLASRARADLTDQTDTVVRRMLRDVRAAVPNSIRIPNSQCFELIPASTGGRARTGPDTVNDTSPACTAGPTCAAVLDPSQATTTFDVLTPLSVLPAVGDWVVVGNQNPNDVYEGTNRAMITALTTPAAFFGRHRLSIASTQFTPGYESGRFSVVPNAQRAVFYICSGADGTLDASGNGKGTLSRLMNYGFNAAYPSNCPGIGSADTMATRVRSCRFIYDPNQGATQQSGFMWIELELARNRETIYLSIGGHVSNVP